MHRNYEAARRVLEAVQQYAGVNGIDFHALQELSSRHGFSGDDWHYAVRLLTDSGFLISDDGQLQMTWSGHNLLETLSDQ
ncbi:hypothetical protein [Pseudomonas bohemica]|uniref:hypothetical protein n=1 Tax=Pseudomonas bohemica TaxID=2044872 RepID=UPI000DA6068F|nr:hypothetical protein [Pseudomonas bohemica]